jgi:hypothetical protein
LRAAGTTCKMGSAASRGIGQSGIDNLHQLHIFAQHLRDAFGMGRLGHWVQCS